MSRFLDALHSGHVLLMDGAMGTELQRAGIGDGESYELWNLTHSEQVRAIHQAYVDSGAEVLLTNTFQAHPDSLSDFPAITESALRIVRRAACADHFVLFDMGPFEAGEQRQCAASGLNAASQGSADGLLVETCSTIDDLAAVMKEQGHKDVAKNGPPILFSWTFLRDAGGTLRTLHGQTPEQCAEEASRYAIVALGVNCGRDIRMDHVIEIVRRYRTVTDLPIFARPNAGTPIRDGNRWVYPLTPEAMAACLPELLKAGVSMVGGCCGTTPQHIAACRPIIDAWNARGAT